jgi:methionyl-tRNA formyltransferase
MRVVYFGNNWVGWQMLTVLREQGAEVVGLVVHPPERAKYRDELIECAGLDAERIFDASKLSQPAIRDGLRALNADIGICGCFGYILRGNVFDMFPLGCLNSHISLLPHNRGAYPNVWSIVERTPAGVTLHYIDDGVDTGDVVAQLEVTVEPIDTGATLYRKLERAAVELFERTWPAIRDRRIERRRQDETGATCHRMADVGRIDEIGLDRCYTGRELINILRARTFPPYRGAFFLDQGRRVYLRLELEYGD